MDRKVLCLWKNVGNFVYGKIYVAECWSVYASTKEPAGFRVTDEDGDYYQICNDGETLSKHWKWVTK
jgi:hypothetical protein